MVFFANPGQSLEQANGVLCTSWQDQRASEWCFLLCGYYWCWVRQSERDNTALAKIEAIKLIECSQLMMASDPGKCNFHRLWKGDKALDDALHAYIKSRGDKNHQQKAILQMKNTFRVALFIDTVK